MGRDMNDVEAACAGSLCGLEGLDDVILKTATLSDAPPGKALPLKSRLGGSEQISELVVRVALEPHTPADVKRCVGFQPLQQVFFKLLPAFVARPFRTERHLDQLTTWRHGNEQ